MKKLFLAALAVATLASCSKEASEVNPVDGDVVNAKLKINFVSNGTKALISDADVAVIEDANVFVLNAANVIQARFYMDATEVATPEEHKVTTAAKKVIVIANVGNIAEGSGVAATVTTKAALEALLGEMTANTAAAGHIWMSGIADVSFDYTSTTDPESKLAKVDMTLSIIPAKIDVKVTNKMSNRTSVNETIEIEGVAVIYSAAYTHFVSTNYATVSPTFPSFIAAESSVTGKYFRTGITAPNWDVYIGDAKNDYLSSLDESWNGGNDQPTIDGIFENTFYALPIDATIGRNTILAVYGTFAGEKLYFPVIFNSIEKGKDKDGFSAVNATLENGKKYNIEIILSGDATKGGGGTPDPETPVDKAYISVNVTPGTWYSVPNFIKEFN